MADDLQAILTCGSALQPLGLYLYEIDNGLSRRPVMFPRSAVDLTENPATLTRLFEVNGTDNGDFS